jgi:AbrB family looped-hinge helix DNA binding protein
VKREAKLTSKGQVTIPGGIRRALRLREGDTLIFETDAQGAYLRLRQPEDVFGEYEGLGARTRGIAPKR